MTLSRAITWSLFWIGLSLLSAFSVGLWIAPELGYQFAAGWLIEKALSIDNLFVFLMLFTYFKVEPKAQRRVLNYGIIGVLVTRGLLIFLGIALVNRFEWLIYILGAVVLYTVFLMLFRNEEEEFDGEKNRIVRWVRKLIPVHSNYHGTKFFIKEKGKRIATPLFLVLIVLELTDVLFSFDSIPAVFSVSRDPYVVFGSNILAVLGLRSLYFVLERMKQTFEHVEKAVGVVLLFVGAKMILPIISPELEISVPISLLVIFAILLTGVLASLISKPKQRVG